MMTFKGCLMHFRRISFYLIVLLPLVHSAIAGDGPLYKPVKYERKYPDVKYEKDWMPEMNTEKYGRFFVVNNNFIITGSDSSGDDSIVST